MDVRKFMRNFTECISRGVQRTEERVGNIQTTPIDDAVTRMMEDLDSTAERTAIILKSVERVLKPFRDQSEEAYIYDTTKRCKTVDRYNPLTQLGKHLIGSVRDVGEKTPFGKTLLLVGQCEKDLGLQELRFVTRTADAVLWPMRDFVRHDVSAALKEKKNLQNRRLDLDAAKMRLKKAKNERQFAAGESAVRFAQVEFDRQMEITRIVLDKTEHSKVKHLKSLVCLVDLQLAHERECTAILKKHKALIEKYLADALDPSAMADVRSTTTMAKTSVASTHGMTERGDTNVIIARCSSDYKAKRPHEITVKLEEIVKVYEENPTNEDPDLWMFIEKSNGKKGYVPIDILKPTSTDTGCPFSDR